MILGAGWDEFLSILALLGGIAPNPSTTNQNCSNCGSYILKKIQDRWHCCHVCGFEPDGN